MGGPRWMKAAAAARIVTAMKRGHWIGMVVMGVCILAAAGCAGRKTFYTKSKVGLDGRRTVEKVYYTPEEMEARDIQLGYVPADARLREIETLWPQLSEEARDDLTTRAREAARK